MIRDRLYKILHITYYCHHLCLLVGVILMLSAGYLSEKLEERAEEEGLGMSNPSHPFLSITPAA